MALVDDGSVIAEEDFPHGLKHTAEIIPIIDRLCRARAWKPADLSELYVSAGPGSFTGLRIGITLAKTLAFATGLKLVSVPSVNVLAENAPPEAKHVIIVLDAKREQIFTARFERVNDHWTEREPAHLDSLTDVLTRAPRPVHLLGEGIPFHKQFIAQDKDVIVTDETLWRARASIVAHLGAALARAGHFADPDTLTPLYIRRPEAEEKYDAAHPSSVEGA